MKLFLILFSLLALTGGCATVSDLQNADTCKVWEENPIGPPRYLEVKGVTAKYTGKCTLPGVLCLWVETTLTKDKRVTLEGNSIFEGQREVATIQGNTAKLDPSFWDSLTKSSDPTVDMNQRLVSRTVTLTLMGIGKEGQDSVHFNSRCQSDQAAIGALALWAGKSKDAGN